MKKNNITVILPIKKYNKKTFDLFKKTIPDGVKLITICKDKIPSVKNINKDVSYEKAINLGVEQCDTEFFTIAGVDDIFSEKWFDFLELYVSENQADVYMQLVMESDKDQNPLGVHNEVFWNMGFSEKVGYVDNSGLQKLGKLSLYGSVFNKESFVECGGIKDNLHCMSEYELFLRMTYQGKTIFVIPKLGYLHVNGIEDSRMEGFKKQITSKQLFKQLEDLAKQEHWFIEQREVQLPL